MDGFINLNKPLGLTSHDCVARVRRLLAIKKVGHGGTLDPAASGVLPIAIGRATRLLPFLPEDKAYRAVIRFGMTTATDDLEGEVLTQTPCPQLTEAAAIAPLPQFLGTIQQIPPQYSAVQVAGKRLYDLARKGHVVEAPVRTVTVTKIAPMMWAGGDFPELTVDIACGAGTYIRAIARDWGQQLGLGATLASLVRTRSSGFVLETSLSLETLAQQIEAQTFCPVEPAIALQHLPKLTLPEPLARRWRQGQKPLISAADVDVSPSWVARSLQIFDEAEQFLGISTLAASDPPHHYQLIPKMVFEPLG